MNIIRHISPAGLPVIADFTIDDEGCVTEMKVHPVMGKTIMTALHSHPFDDEIIEETQDSIQDHPEMFNLPNLNI